MSSFQLLAILVFVVFAVTGSASYGVWRYLNPTRTASDRLRDFSDTEAKDEVVEILGGGGSDVPNPLMERLSKLAAPASDEDRNRLRQMLVQAGYRSRRAPDMFNAIRVSAAICLPVLMSPVLASLGMTSAAVGVFVAAAAGYYGPMALVQNTITKRKNTLLKAFPDALDLLVSSVEAGLGLDAAFRRVSAELEGSSAELAREFQGVNHEIGAGVARITAMKHLYERTGLDEIRSLVNMLSQAERFGSSVAKGLRVHSKTVRQRRMSRAEEIAAQVSPKLTVVMILTLLPTLMMVILGPAAVSIYHVMNG